jgi:hypothetical protein
MEYKSLLYLGNDVALDGMQRFAFHSSLHALLGKIRIAIRFSKQTTISMHALVRQSVAFHPSYIIT